MINALAIWIVLALVAFFALDAYVLHLGAGLFLARRGVDLIHTLAFWR